MSANIFISFASQDRGVAMTLCSALESRGFKCWISARDILPGENFQISIVRAIREAKIMLLVFTANSNNSEEMSKELALASQNKLMVVPLRVEDVTPNDAFSYEFATRQWIDFFADWELAIQQLAHRIEKVESATRAASASAEGTPGPAVEAALPPAPIVVTPTIDPPKAKRAGRKDAEVFSDRAPSAGVARPRRTGVYLTLSLVVLIAAGVGVMASRWLRADARPAAARAMVVMPAAPPADPALAAAASAAAGSTDIETPADKPPPRKHKAPVVKPADQDVPF